MDKIEKALAKFTDKEREAVKVLLEKIRDSETRGLDIKKLKRFHDIFRAKKGTIRIIFRIVEHTLVLLKVDRRNDSTYSDY